MSRNRIPPARRSTSVRIKELWIYPVKGWAGIRMKRWPVTTSGLFLDRAAVVIDADTGEFVAQRDYPKKKEGVDIAQMCLVTPRFSGMGRIIATAPGMEPIEIDLLEERGQSCTARIWGTEYDAIEVDPKASRWVTHCLSRYRPGAYRLVSLLDAQRRSKDDSTFINGQDAHGLLVIGQESLDEANRRAVDEGFKPVPMNRFRPNIVIEGALPFWEDTPPRLAFKRRGRTIILKNAGRCVRCVATDIDQKTGERGHGVLAALGKHRRFDGDICFGANYAHTDYTGQLREGDPVCVP